MKGPSAGKGEGEVEGLVRARARARAMVRVMRTVVLCRLWPTVALFRPVQEREVTHAAVSISTQGETERQFERHCALG